MTKRTMQNSDSPVADDARPVSLHEMPFTLDIRALLAYAKSKGIEPSMLSEYERRQFLLPNPTYKRKHTHGIVAAL